MCIYIYIFNISFGVSKGNEISSELKQLFVTLYILIQYLSNQNNMAYIHIDVGEVFGFRKAIQAITQFSNITQL